MKEGTWDIVAPILQVVVDKEEEDCSDYDQDVENRIDEDQVNELHAVNSLLLCLEIWIGNWLTLLKMEPLFDWNDKLH